MMSNRAETAAINGEYYSGMVFKNVLLAEDFTKNAEFVGCKFVACSGVIGGTVRNCKFSGAFRDILSYVDGLCDYELFIEGDAEGTNNVAMDAFISIRTRALDSWRFETVLEEGRLKSILLNTQRVRIAPPRTMLRGTANTLYGRPLPEAEQCSLVLLAREAHALGPTAIEAWKRQAAASYGGHATPLLRELSTNLDIDDTFYHAFAKSCDTVSQDLQKFHRL